MTMVKKLFFSLVAFVAGLVSVWGAVRFGWTFEMGIPATVTFVSLGIAFAVGNRPVAPVAPRAAEERMPWTFGTAAASTAPVAPPPEWTKPPSADEPAVEARPRRQTQPYRWGQLTGTESSASGPTGY